MRRTGGHLLRTCGQADKIRKILLVFVPCELPWGIGMSRIYDLMKRYVGHRVSITIHSQMRLVGKVASVHDDGVLLVDTVEENELEEQGWYAQICHANPEDDTRPRQAESLISWHAILVASCLDDDIALPQPAVDEKAEDSTPEPFVIISQGGELAGHDTNEGGLPFPMDRFLLEIGVQLIPMMRAESGRQMFEKIGNLRQHHTRQAGWCFPKVRIRDDFRLDQNGYRVSINGCEVASSHVQPGRCLAIPSDEGADSLEGEETTEPVFGHTAYWIDSERRCDAEQQGYTVADVPGVIVTHLGEIVRRYGGELLGYEQVQQMVDHVEEVAPTVVREFMEETGAVSAAHYVLRRLLEERVSLRCVVSVLECLGHHRRTTSDLEKLTSAVRVSIGRQICEPFRDDEGRVRVLVFDPEVKKRVAESIDSNMDTDTLGCLLDYSSKDLFPRGKFHEDAALLVDTSIRRQLWRHVARVRPGLSVIAYQEIPADLMLEPVQVVGPEELDSAYELTENSREDGKGLARKTAAKIAGFAQSAVPRQPR